MGKCLFMRKGETHTEPVTFSPVFADNTWEQIIEAVQKNKVPETWIVGSQKTMTINGTDYVIDIIGKNHDTYSDGSGKAPLTFQMHDCYATKYALNSTETNSGGWTSCVMRKTHLPAILALMPTEVQAGIKEVNKLTSAGSESSTINTTADKLFLLSELEIFTNVINAKTGEGTQYEYYKAGNSRVKKIGNTASNWWERSPCGTNKTNFCYVYTDGNNSYNVDANLTQGVSFAFCF